MHPTHTNIFSWLFWPVIHMFTAVSVTKRAIKNVHCISDSVNLIADTFSSFFTEKVAATICWLSENPKSQTCCHLLHALSLLPLLPYIHPSHIERYLNSWHVANYIITRLQPNHSPTESSCHRHPSDHSHDQLLFSFCWTHQLHYSFLGLRGRHSGCHGKVSFLARYQLSTWVLNITARGNCSLPYSQPHWDWSSNCMDFRTLAMQMTPRYTCLFPQMNLQSQTVSWAYPHGCQIITSNLKLVQPSSCFSWLTNPFITTLRPCLLPRLFKVLESWLMINCLFLII